MNLTMLRGLIREMVEEMFHGYEVEEKLDGRDYEINIYHPKSFPLPGGETYIAHRYDSSQLRAKIDESEGTMELVNIRVAPDLQRKGIGTKMIKAALNKAQELGLQVRTSGMYSPHGKALVQSFIDRGEISPNLVGGKHVMNPIK